MTLYKADFLELHGEAVKTTTKKSTKKAKKEIENVEPVESVEEETRPVTGGKQLPEPVKKPKTEKQLAALERARENRKRKREEAELAEKSEQEAVEQAKKAVAEKEAEIEKKKAEQREKRRLKKERVQEPTPSADGISEAVDEAVEVKEVKVRKPKKAKVVTEKIDEPPAWFKKYIEGHEMEKNSLSKEKRPVNEIKKESKQVASQAWADDLTRDRVNQERDNHMSRMYSSIFGSKLR